MSFTGRMNCTGVSPLTEGLLSSNAGGFRGILRRRATVQSN